MRKKQNVAERVLVNSINRFYNFNSIGYAIGYIIGYAIL